MVLGVLAILILLGVSFAISMRTERLTSDAYLNQVKAKYLTYAALSMAMGNINTNVLQARSGPWPTSQTYLSGDPANANSVDNLYAGEATNYFPGGAVIADLLIHANSVKWSNVVDPVSGDLIGRVAYLAANCSGLLDANHIGGGVARNMGEDPAEISFSTTLLPEMKDAGTFVGNRAASWIRFETVPDLYFLGRYDGGVFHSRPTNFFVYSRFPNGWRDSDPTVPGGLVASSRIYIGGTEADLVGRVAEIQAAFEDMGLPQANAQQAVLGLVDYVDADNVPGNLGTGEGDLNTFATEATPLINEIGFDLEVVYSDETFLFSVSSAPWVEVLFPFEGASNSHDYTLEIEIKYKGALALAGFLPPDLDLPQAAILTPAAGTWAHGEYQISVPAIAAGISSGVSYDPNDESFKTFAAQVLVRLVEDTGAKVDEVILPANKCRLNWIPSTENPPNPAAGGFAVNDPRLNYIQNEWVAVGVGQTNGSTAGGFNTGVCNPAAGDGRVAMYVRNAPLDVPGELGFLLYDSTAPWSTIRLVGPGYLPVLDYFTTTNTAVRFGLVNPNSRNESVLASVFQGMPVEHYPSEAGGLNITVAEAQDLADRMIQYTRQPSTQFTNVSDLGKLTVANLEDDVPTATNQPLVESIIRNSANLFDPRQNLFTIIVAAQAVEQVTSLIDENSYVNVKAEQRALAVVWRDPYPDATGEHPTMIRYWRWLTEWGR